MTRSYVSIVRSAYHQRLFSNALGLRGANYSNADVASVTSRTISKILAQGMAHKINLTAGPIPDSGQTLGKRFTSHTLWFVKTMFLELQDLRPGDWGFALETPISQYQQYAHLAQLDKLAQDDRQLRAIVGSDYLIKPDITVFRQPLDDGAINRVKSLVSSSDPGIAERTLLRQSQSTLPLLHASISCKWTIRSDRSQNSRTEALNLIRNRKGPIPQIVVVTAEPLPKRIASIALGTGDIDCVYHMALPELNRATNFAMTLATPRNRSAFVEQQDALDTMVEGRRLRDISDLPFDLII